MFVRNLSHDNVYLRWVAIFDLGAIGHQQAVQVIVAAKVPNSLKLLNLTRILEAVLDSDRRELEITHSLLNAIDDLLIQL